MAAGSKRGRDTKLARPGKPRFGSAPLRRKSCLLCKHKAKDVDYKDVALLRKFVSERGKIRSRRMSGACRKHQRLVAVAVKRAREMALLPYVDRDAPERPARPPRQQNTHN